MPFYLKTTLFLGGLISLIFACQPTEETTLVKEEEPYELFIKYGNPTADRYMRRHLITYFQQIALYTEYGSEFPLIKKWTKPMTVYVSGNADVELLNELQEIIKELNNLFLDGFQINVTNDSLASNYHIFLGDKHTYGRMYPAIAHLLDENSGLFHIKLNSDFSIASGHMYVDIEKNTLRFQKHILREELTQSLGLPNDIDYYVNSIFYKKWTDVQVYSELDIEVIRLLYHPQMIPRIGSSTVERILENILGI